MKKNKKYLLIQLLNSFSPQEMKRFSHFIKSAYFNTDQWAIKLFNTLRQEIIAKIPFNETSQLKVYRLVFGESSTLTKKQKQLLWAKMGLLTNLAKRFLIVDALEENTSYQTELLNTQLLRKEQYRLYNKFHTKNKDSLEKINKKGIDHYDLAFQVEKWQLNYLYQSGQLLRQNNFSAFSYNLNLYYILCNLQLCVTMLSLKSVTKITYDFSPMEQITALLVLPQYATHPLIIIYKQIMELMEKKEEAIFFHIRDLLKQYKSEIPKEDLINFYNVLGNYCNNQVKKGVTKYNQELFDLWKFRDEQGLVLEEEFMQAMGLKNIVVIACVVQAFEWAIEVVNKYSPYIRKELQKSVHQYNLGVIEFYKQQYKAAISHFIRVEKVNWAYDLDSRLMLLQSYYLLDKEYDERTMQIFRSAEHFVRISKTIPAIHKKSYKNFIQILMNLYRVRHQVGKKSIESVRHQFAKTDTILARGWLVSKIEELSTNN